VSGGRRRTTVFSLPRAPRHRLHLPGLRCYARVREHSAVRFLLDNAPKQGPGLLFRNLVDFIAERGLANEMLVRVSPETGLGQVELKTSSRGGFLPLTPRAP
jgi:hypothetical protein